MQIQAAVMLRPGQIEIREFEKPTPADDALLLQVDQVGICGSDKHMYLGHTTLKFPVIPGHEVVGTVAEIDKTANRVMNVSGGPIEPGDRVTIVPGSKNCDRCYYCLHVPGRRTLCSGRTIYGFSNSETPPYLNGEFSEYTYIHGNSWVYKMPAGISEETAVLTEPAAVATRAVICNKDPDICGVWAYPQIQFQAALNFLQITRAPLQELITHHLPLP